MSIHPSNLKKNKTKIFGFINTLKTSTYYNITLNKQKIKN